MPWFENLLALRALAVFTETMENNCCPKKEVQTASPTWKKRILKFSATATKSSKATCIPEVRVTFWVKATPIGAYEGGGDGPVVLATSTAGAGREQRRRAAVLRMGGSSDGMWLPTFVKRLAQFGWVQGARAAAAAGGGKKVR
ncbi:hypothetical protein B0H13DRAFT_1873597 [Mycena leptocephala]|nr:hypothetical protein B0H13DRAFT_1873597 [Mycena leptocephala]